MAPRLKTFFKTKSDSQRNHTEFAGRLDKDNMPQKENSPKIDLLDTELFSYDYDLWFAKSMFQYSLARVIENEHWGHACINPEDVMKQVEAAYSSHSNEDPGSHSKIHPPGHQLYEQINHARAARNDKTLEVFLNELSNQIRRHCRLLRNEKLAELDADELHGCNPRRHSATPSSSTGSCSSPEESQEALRVFKDTERETGGIAIDENVSSDEFEEPKNTNILEHGSSIQSTPEIDRPASPLSQPSSNQIPMHRYTSLLWEYGASSGKTPTYVKGWTTQESARYIASFDGIKVVGEAPKSRDAKHDASRKICEILGIPNF